MKSLTSIAMIVSVLMLASQAFSSINIPGPTVFNQIPKAVYVPVGFDTNDNTQVVIEGQFTNSCYRPGVTEFNIDYQTRTIRIANKAHEYNADFCLMVILDYKKEINLGVVSYPGVYNIQFLDNNNQLQSLGAIQVNQATTNSADDYLYMPIRSAEYVKTNQVENGDIVLKGAITNSCMSFDQIVVTRPSVGVIQVLPIAKLDQRSDCQLLENPIPFEQRVSLRGYGKGKVLIHIRSLNGQAVNLINWL